MGTTLHMPKFGVPAPDEGRPMPGQPSAGPDIDYTAEVSNAFKMSAKDTVRLVANATGLLHAAATKMSEKLGTPVHQELGEMRGYLNSIADSIEVNEKDLAHPEGLADKIKVGLARAIGAAPLEVAKYGAATVLTRSPARGMALIDSLREMDQVTWEAANRAAVAGARGAVTGKLLDLSSSLPTVPRRMMAGGVISGTTSAMAGRDPHDIVVDVITGSVFDAMLGARPSAKVPDKTQPPPDVRAAALKVKPTPGQPGPQKFTTEVVSGIPVTSAARGLGLIPGSIRDPGVMFENLAAMTRKAVNQAREADIMINSETQNALDFAHAAFRLVPKSERKTLIQALDDSSINILKMPATWSPKMREAYAILRTTLEQKRQLIIETKRKLGETVPDDWGRPEGYFPHVFEGGWAVLRKDKNGITDAIDDNGWLQVNKAKAIEAASDYKAKHPNVDVEVLEVRKMGDGMRRSLHERYMGNVQRRERNLPGWASDEEGLYHYLRGIERYARISELRPTMEAGRKELVDLFNEGSREVKLWDAYVDKLEGRPQAWVDAFNRRWLQKGGDPDIVQRGSGFLLATQGLLKLGASPASAAWNMLQTVHNTLPVLGPKYTEKGIRGLASGKYQWLLERLRVGTEETHAEANSLRHYVDVRNWPETPREIPQYVAASAQALGLMMFRKAEDANRGVAVIGAYLRAIDNGANYEKAIEIARHVEMRTQFHNGPAGTPILFANPFMKTVMQFKSYMIKQLEFMVGLGRKDVQGRFDSRATELRRFLGATLATTGITGVLGVEGLDFFFKKATGRSLLDEVREFSYDKDETTGEMKPNAAALLVRGVPGTVLGFEMKQAGMGDWPAGDPDFYTFERAVGGPVVADVTNVVKWLAANKGQESEESWNRLTLGLSPAFRRVYNAWLSDAANRGELRDVKGRLITDRITLARKFLMTAGFTPIDQAIERERVGAMAEDAKRRESVRRYLLNQATEAIQEGRHDDLEPLFEQSVRNGTPLMGRAITQAYKSSKEKLGDKMERMNRKRYRVPMDGTAPPPGSEETVRIGGVVIPKALIR